MFLRTFRMVLVLLLMTTESEQTEPNATMTSAPPETPPGCTCPSAAPEPPPTSAASPSSCAPQLAFITVGWTSACEGEVLFHPTDSSSWLCHSNETVLSSLLRGVCEGREGCYGEPQGLDTTHCHTFKLRCLVQGQQPQVYKVLTALLCCVLVVLLLVRFCRPTVSALQRRLSDRRQSRWIGPTQSHSVSYQRGKAAVKPRDRGDAPSFPALEQLAARSSRDCSTEIF